MAHLVEDLLNDVYKQVDEDLKNYTQIWTECEQWLDDVVKEAEKIFRKNDQTNCSEEPDDSLPIILLPTTPGVKSIAAAREKRLRKKSSLPTNRVSMKIRKSGSKFRHMALKVSKINYTSTPVTSEPIKNITEHQQSPPKEKSMEDGSPRRTRGSKAATVRKPLILQDKIESGIRRTTRSQTAKQYSFSTVKSASKGSLKKHLIENNTDSDDFEDGDSARPQEAKVPKLKINEIPPSPFTKAKPRSKVTQVVMSPMHLVKLSTPNARSTPIRTLMGRTTSKISQEELQVKRTEELRLKEHREKLARLRKEQTDKLKAERAKQDRETRQKRFLDSKSKLQDKKRLEADARQRVDKEIEDQRLRDDLERQKEALRKIKEDEERRKKIQEVQRKEQEEKRRKDELEKLKMRKIREEEEVMKRKAEEQERIKQVEEAKIRFEKQKLEKIRLAEEENRKNYQIQKEDINKTFCKEENGANMNTTFTKTSGTINSSQCYEMTPSKEDLPPEPLKVTLTENNIDPDDDNYDIRDLRSDEDTDDESKPRKVVPIWAQGEAFRSALIKQAFQSQDLVDHLFYVMDASIDLEKIFAKKCSRYNKRTSSAAWGLPPLSHKY